jgi:hypothetical protein
MTSFSLKLEPRAFDEQTGSGEPNGSPFLFVTVMVAN